MIELYKDFDEIETYRHDWDLLAAKKNIYLLTFDWFRCCAHSFHLKDELYLLCLIQNKKLIAVAPLYRSYKNEEKHMLQIIGSRRLYEPSSLLYDSNIALEKLLKALKKSPYPVYINRIYKHFEIDAHIHRLNKNGLFVPVNAAGSQYLELNDSFKKFEAGLSSKRRNDLHRAYKKANVLGTVDFDISQPDTNAVKPLLQKAFLIEDSSWKHKAESSILQNSDLTSFFNCLFKHASEKNQAVLGFMNINGVAVACNLAILKFDKLWILKIGYNNKYKSCSPGILLTHEMINYAYKKNLKEFEFLGCIEKWIKLWNPLNRNYQSYLFYPLSLKGLSGLIYDFVTIVKRKVINKFKLIK